MKKTYINKPNSSSYFRIGKALVRIDFDDSGEYTTDNPLWQKAIENSYSFKTGELQLVTPSMTWIKIERDESGYVTEECLYKIFSHLPVVLHHNKMGGGYDVLNPQTESLKLYFREGIKTSKTYTHYLPIPKV